jgi:predicted Zn-dependent protease
LLAGKRELPEAAHEYGEAIRLKPEFAGAHLVLARVLAAGGDMPGAIEQLRKAAAGSDPQVAQLAAQALQRLGQ